MNTTFSGFDDTVKLQAIQAVDLVIQDIETGQILKTVMPTISKELDLHSLYEFLKPFAQNKVASTTTAAMETKTPTLISENFLSDIIVYLEIFKIFIHIYIIFICTFNKIF